VPHRRARILAGPRSRRASSNAQVDIFAVVLLGWNFYLGSRADAAGAAHRVPYSPFF